MHEKPDSTDSLPTKKPDGRFVKGQSGNPNGRKPGTKLMVTRMREELGNRLSRDAKAILEKVIEQAKAGNEVSQKMLLDRLWPVERALDGRRGGGGAPNVHIVIEQTQPDPPGAVIDQDD